jgi:hypothetical protein
MSTHNYFGIQLSVSTKVNLLAALAAVDSLVPATVRELTIQNDASSGASLYIGDANISSTRYGVELVNSSTAPPFKQYGQGSDLISVPIASIYLLSAGTSKVNVEGWTG